MGAQRHSSQIFWMVTIMISYFDFFFAKKVRNTTTLHSESIKFTGCLVPTPFNDPSRLHRSSFSCSPGCRHKLIKLIVNVSMTSATATPLLFLHLYYATKRWWSSISLVWRNPFSKKQKANQQKFSKIMRSEGTVQQTKICLSRDKRVNCFRPDILIVVSLETRFTEGGRRNRTLRLAGER
jgi:hypothetical protein